jgi:2-methylcitrate dehydratase PrpD
MGGNAAKSKSFYAAKTPQFRSFFGTQITKKPDDPCSAMFALQHCLAVALADGHVPQSSFDENSCARVAANRSKVSVSLSPEVDASYPKRGAHI